jgi:hypothetical protein
VPGELAPIEPERVGEEDRCWAAGVHRSDPAAASHWFDQDLRPLDQHWPGFVAVAQAVEGQLGPDGVDALWRVAINRGMEDAAVEGAAAERAIRLRGYLF